MGMKRAHVLLPGELLREIDALVGPRGRSSFLVETARNEVRRQRLLQFLEGKGSKGKNAGAGSGPAWKDPIWQDKDHPELAGGSAGWVRKLRSESEARHARRKRTRN